MWAVSGCGLLVDVGCRWMWAVSGCGLLVDVGC